MEKVTLNLLDLISKARSKSKLYLLWVTDGGMYLPPYKLCIVDFIADILNEKKNVNYIVSQASFISH